MNSNYPCFDWKRPCFGGLTFKNRGHWGSRYIEIYLYICIHIEVCFLTQLGIMIVIEIPLKYTADSRYRKNPISRTMLVTGDVESPKAQWQQ